MIIGISLLRYFRHVENLNPEGEHTVKVALGTRLSDLIKYLESIRDFLLLGTPFNRARITFSVGLCPRRPTGARRPGNGEARGKNGRERGDEIALPKLIGGNTGGHRRDYSALLAPARREASRGQVSARRVKRSRRRNAGLRGTRATGTFVSARSSRA